MAYRVFPLRFPLRVLVELELPTYPPTIAKHVVEVSDVDELLTLLEGYAEGRFNVVGILLEEVEE